MSQSTREWKYSLTIRKHIPSGRQYVPADEIVTSVRWDDGEGLSWHERFQGLNEATAQAIREWLNTAVVAIAPESQRPEPTPTRPELKPPAEAEIERLPWRPYHEGHSAGWVFQNLEDPGAKQLNAYLEAQEKLPATIGKYRYRFSGPEDNPRMFISRAPVEKA